jgi:hypothetical protein
LESMERVLGVSGEAVKPLSFDDDEHGPGFVSKLAKVLHETLLVGSLQRMNADALSWSLQLANISGSADGSPPLPNRTSHCATGALDTSRTSRCPTALLNGRDKVSGL